MEVVALLAVAAFTACWIVEASKYGSWSYGVSAILGCVIGWLYHRVTMEG